MKLSILFLALLIGLYLTGAVICLVTLPVWPVAGAVSFVLYTLCWLPLFKSGHSTLSGFVGGDGI